MSREDAEARRQQRTERTKASSESERSLATPEAEAGAGLDNGSMRGACLARLLNEGVTAKLKLERDGFQVELLAAEEMECISKEISYLFFECVRELLFDSITETNMKIAKVSLEVTPEYRPLLLVENFRGGLGDRKNRGVQDSGSSIRRWST